MRITGADILRDEKIMRGDVAVHGTCFAESAGAAIDLSGYWMLPGIIDLHGDAFERQILPRATAPFPMRTGLIATDREAAANGVTTAMLAQSWSWELGFRGPDFAEELMAALAAYKSSSATDLRIQIRCETHTVDWEARLLRAIDAHGVGYLIFNDHLPEGLYLAEHHPEHLGQWAAKHNRSAEEQLAIMRAAAEQTDRVPGYLGRLSAALRDRGIPLGSHDDATAEQREDYHGLGARVCEFPTTLEAAQAARKLRDPILMGAPNIVRGGSQSGNIAAIELIRRGLCDALVSDYHYPALPAAAFALMDGGELPLAKAWALISTNAARVLGMADRGSIEPGLCADACFVNRETRVIEGTMAAGRWSFISGELARRVMAAPAEAREMAA